MSGGSAALYSVLGDNDAAFHALDRAYGRHELWLIYLNVDPVWDNLRSDPRFVKLTRRVGLPQTCAAVAPDRSTSFVIGVPTPLASARPGWLT